MDVKYEEHTYVVAGSVEQNTPDLATHLPQVQANRKVVITQINHSFPEQIAASRFVVSFVLQCVGNGQGWLVLSHAAWGFSNVRVGVSTHQMLVGVCVQYSA